MSVIDNLFQLCYAVPGGCVVNVMIPDGQKMPCFTDHLQVVSLDLGRG